MKWGLGHGNLGTSLPLALKGKSQGNSNKASLKLVHEGLEPGLVSQPGVTPLSLQVGVQRPCWGTGRDMTQPAVGNAMSWE